MAGSINPTTMHRRSRTYHVLFAFIIQNAKTEIIEGSVGTNPELLIIMFNLILLSIFRLSS